VSLQGADGPSFASMPLPIVEMQWEYTGILTIQMQLQRELPDDVIATARLILNLIRSQGQGQSRSASAGGLSSKSTASGAGGSSTLRVTDGTNTYSATLLKFLAGSITNPSTGEVDYSLPAGSLVKMEWFTATAGTYTTPSLVQAAVAVLMVIRSRSTLETTDFSFASNEVTVPGCRAGDKIGVLYSY